MAKILKDKKGTLLNLIVDLTESENNIYFTYKNKIYHVLDKLTSDNSLRKQMNKQKINIAIFWHNMATKKLL